MKLSNGPALFLAATLSESANAQLSTMAHGAPRLRGLEAEAEAAVSLSDPTAMSMAMIIDSPEQGGEAKEPNMEYSGKSGKISGKSGKSTKAEPTAGYGCNAPLPSLVVPRCDHGKHTATATINKRLGTLAADFPVATVGLCYTDTTLELTFEAQQETSYLVNDAFVNNDDIWLFTTMEAFISVGDHDPTQYFQFDVNPDNVIWTAYIHNPYKNFTSSAAAFVEDWDSYPITSATTKDVEAQTWKSDVSLPLSMFNVEEPEGTKWRMNFNRLYFADETSNEEFGQWNPNESATFHQTPCFGKVRFA